MEARLYPLRDGTEDLDQRALVCVGEHSEYVLGRHPKCVLVAVATDDDLEQTPDSRDCCS